MGTYTPGARRLDEQGEDGLEDWQAAYQIGMRGSFLSHEPYIEWADWRRGRVSELLWQSVNAQWKRAASWEAGTSGIEAAGGSLVGDERAVGTCVHVGRLVDARSTTEG